jgi:hypothetical protein
MMDRMTAHPGPLTAIVAGVILFGPSVGFIAAVQAIGTARAGDLATAVALLMVVGINVALVWLPLLAYLVRPGFTTRTLRSFTGWLSAHGRAVTTAALLVIGAILVIDGIIGLI